MKPVTRLARVAACLALLNFAVPGGALVSFGVPLRESAEAALAARAREARDLAARRAKSASRLLTAEEERTTQGRAGENPYLAGQSKWDVVYKGVDLMTGNYSTSATDLSFDGGYGIPVNVTRSYSANNADEGPFGKGWTLSADVRSTAGGLLKSGGAPVRSVPVGFKERPALETDPNAELATGAPAQPVEAVIATDAGGDQETVQKDIDGVLTTPPWDTNVNENTQYETVAQGGATYQVMVHNETVTAEGTRYVYDKKGSYLNGGTKPWDKINDSSVAAQPANVLKVVSATDRQGNVTTYLYGTNTFDYAKSNGTTRENPLISVSMPGGHVISLVWGSTGAATGRIASISDGAGGRTIAYTYTGSTGSGLLETATSAGGKTTTYGYASGPLSTIRDPRLLTTTIAYGTAPIYLPPLGGYVGSCTVVTSLTAPNGVVDTFGYSSTTNPGIGCLVYTSVGGKNLDRLSVQGWSGSGVFNILANRDIISYQFQTTNFISRRQTTYDAASQNLVSAFSSDGLGFGLQHSGIRTDSHSLTSYRQYEPNRRIDNSTTYSFLGTPLTKTTQESLENTDPEAPGLQVTRTATVGYAYWGPDKYFQQKAVKDQSGRYSFTDYYPRTAAAGKRGQTYRVYDPKNGGIVDTSDPAYPVPSYTPPVPSDKVWRYRVRPAAGQYSAQFDYDAQGRPTDVWKLQKTTTSPWSYVQTHTTYGADGAPGWGQAASVVEDYGGINRTTVTNAYTAWGKASDVTDAKGQRFVTSFDNDGLVNSVTRTDVTPNVPIVTYVYGTSGVSLGQPTSVTDGLSGVVQTISYTLSGGGIGMPSSVTETNGSDSYSTSYTYSTAGERLTATYATPDGTSRWGYFDYVPVGDPASSSRAFETLCRLDASGNRTAEEMHYAYDSGGRLIEAAFAQSPAAGFTPAAGAPWYDGSHPAAGRARTHYEYDAGGRLTSTQTGTETWNGSGYGNQTLAFRNDCTYEVTTSASNPNRGLKTSSYFSTRKDDGSYASRTETYGYDASLDYLTSANYGDTLPNQTPTWSYDAAGNRNDAVVDNLNRTTTLGGQPVTNDILGNRLTRAGTTFAWDALNRLASINGTTFTYKYRADGMRVAKANGSDLFAMRYDGQTLMEERNMQYGAVKSLTRYGLGARGVDMVETTKNSVTTTAFPIYDAHGNQAARLYRSGTGWQVADRQSLDAWGVVRSQQSGTDGRMAYCASLGHQTAEYGLTYMRARYYEPTSGRFVSEDPGRHDGNWFAYAKGNPISGVDASGKFTFIDLLMSFTDEAKIRGAQLKALLATMQTATGAAVASIMTGQFREAIAIYECNVDAVDDVTGAKVLEGMAEAMENPETWNKVYLTFRGRGELTGDEYEAFVHLFSDGTRIFDAEYHSGN